MATLTDVGAKRHHQLHVDTHVRQQRMLDRFERFYLDWLQDYARVNRMDYQRLLEERTQQQALAKAEMKMRWLR